MVVDMASGQEIALSGRLDVSAVAEVRAALHDALDAGSGDLVVDLAGVEVIDATGLGVLLGADRRAKLLDRRIVLRDAAPPRPCGSCGSPGCTGCSPSMPRSAPPSEPPPAAPAGVTRR